MIKLVFTQVRDTFTIEVKDKVITYQDSRKFPNGFQFMPKDPNFKRIVICSRNRIPLEILKWVEEANSGKNLEEYQSAKTDEDLVPIIIRDAETKGCVFQGRGK